MNESPIWTELRTSLKNNDQRGWNQLEEAGVAAEFLKVTQARGWPE